MHIKPGCGQSVSAEVIRTGGGVGCGDDYRAASVLGDGSAQVWDVLDDLGGELGTVIVDGGFVVGGGVAG